MKHIEDWAGSGARRASARGAIGAATGNRLRVGRLALGVAIGAALSKRRRPSGTCREAGEGA
jgi:hypothetical protein